MHQRRQHRAADHKLKCQEALEPEFAREPQWAAHVYEPSLRPAFEPAGALASPGADPRGRFLVSGRADHRCAETEPREPHAEIGVLGYIVGIPAPDFAQSLRTEMRH